MEGSVFIAGTGSYAAEVADWAADAGLEVVGLIEMLRRERVGSLVHGIPVAGLEERVVGGRALLGLGGDRRANWEQLREAGWAPVGLVHPTAHVSGGAGVDPSAMIGPLSVVGAGAEIGEQAMLSRGVLVGHHVELGAYATLNPGVNVGGNSRVGLGAFLGMGCVVVNGTSVGAGATIGAGAVVLDDVPPGSRVQGVPARPYSE